MIDALAPERRSASIEVRARGRRLEGYAALFGVRARIGAVDEEIRQGAFTGTGTGFDALPVARNRPRADAAPIL